MRSVDLYTGSGRGAEERTHKGADYHHYEVRICRWISCKDVIVHSARQIPVSHHRLLPPSTCCITSGVILGRFHCFIFIFCTVSNRRGHPLPADLINEDSWFSFLMAHDSVSAAEHRRLHRGEFPNRSE